MIHRFFSLGWIGIALAFFLYSFTQVDLSLTLNQASVVQGLQKSFQYIGYFQRPLATYLYIVLLIASFPLFFWTLKLVFQKKIKSSTLWKTIIGVSVILCFSYNAFSYDIFNYMFDAKIVTYYQENPYQHKALDYPQDPMLSFMHWTHRVYPYGPAWLGLTVPLSFVGFQFFLPTFFLFKILMTVSFLGCCYLIYRICQKTKLVDPLFALAFFALNPFVLIESLISAHNDIVMMFFALLAIYLLVVKKTVLSGLSLLFSGAIKFATWFLIPAFVLFFVRKNIREFLYLSIILMIIAVGAATYRTTFQPWYLLLVLPIAALTSNKYFILIPSIVLSLAATLQYIPFLYTGNWDPPIPLYNSYIMIGGVVFSALVTGMVYLKKK